VAHFLCDQKMLKWLSSRLAKTGGEEFIICYSNVSNSEEVAAVAERFRKKVEEYIFEGEETQHVTISMGISLSSQNKTLDELIGEADNALYQSKQQGRNRIKLFKFSS
jgi:diguanylate cyclase